MTDMYLNPTQVVDMVKTAEREGEVIVVRCVRKGKASKAGGPDKGDLYDLHCTTKPEYTPKTANDRKAEDRSNGVLTVYVVNRQNRKTGAWGDWRRVNVAQVKKIIYKGGEYEVVHTGGYGA